MQLYKHFFKQLFIWCDRIFIEWIEFRPFEVSYNESEFLPLFESIFLFCWVLSLQRLIFKSLVYTWRCLWNDIIPIFSILRLSYSNIENRKIFWKLFSIYYIEDDNQKQTRLEFSMPKIPVGFNCLHMLLSLLTTMIPDRGMLTGTEAWSLFSCISIDLHLTFRCTYAVMTFCFVICQCTVFLFWGTSTVFF